MRIALLDLHGIFWNKYFGFAARAEREPEAIQSAVNSVLSFISRLRSDYDYVGIAVDIKPYLRLKIDQAYKSDRDPKPAGAAGALNGIIMQLRREGVTILGEPGREADDMIASAIRSIMHRLTPEMQESSSITVYTLDKDLCQLVTAGLLKVELSTFDGSQVTGEGEVVAKFGVPPRLVHDWLALVGDLSDGIEGVKGIGKVHANSLLVGVKGKREALTVLEIVNVAEGNGGIPDWVEQVPKGIWDRICTAVGSGTLQRAYKLVELYDSAPVDLDQLLGTVPDREPGDDSHEERELPPQSPPSSDMGPPEAIESVEETTIEHGETALPPPPTELPPLKIGRNPQRAAPPLKLGRFTVETASRKDAKARIAITGPSGSGKTFTALEIARGLTDRHERIILIDTENGSAAKYADGEWRQLVLPDFALKTYIEAIMAAQEHADVLIIDSASHAWAGPGGALEMADQEEKRTRNKMTAWRAVTPLQNRFVDSMLRCSCHLIVTMRVKTEWVFEQDRRGKQIPRKIGTKSVQREGLEYEFDIVGNLTYEHELVIEKTRLQALDGKVIELPSSELGKQIRGWLTA